MTRVLDPHMADARVWVQWKLASLTAVNAGLPVPPWPMPDGAAEPSPYELPAVSEAALIVEAGLEAHRKTFETRCAYDHLTMPEEEVLESGSVSAFAPRTQQPRHDAAAAPSFTVVTGGRA